MESNSRFTEVSLIFKNIKKVNDYHTQKQITIALLRKNWDKIKDLEGDDQLWECLKIIKEVTGRKYPDQLVKENLISLKKEKAHILKKELEAERDRQKLENARLARIHRIASQKYGETLHHHTTLPGFETRFNPEVHPDYTDTVCSICRSDLEENEELFSSHCFHLFHGICFETYWRINMQRCPNCRGTLPLPENQWRIQGMNHLE